MNKNLNEKLLAFFILSNSFQMIIYFYTNLSLPFQYLYLAMIIFAFISNHFKIHKELVYFLIVISVIVGFNYVFFPLNRTIMFSYIEEFCIRGGVALFLFSYISDYKKLFNYLYYYSIINTVLLIPVPFLFVERYNIVGYMSYGYYLLSSFIIILIYLFYFKQHRLINIILILLSLFTITIYGAKGNLVLIILLLFILIFNKPKKFKYLLYTSPLLFLFIYKIEAILKLLHVDSYSIKTFILLFTEEGYLYHSRLGVFARGINYINTHPLINGIGAFKLNDIDSYYPHNLFIQLLIEHGVFIGSILIISLGILIIYTIIKIPKKSYNNLIFIFLLVEAAKLMISRNYWTDLTFWILIYFLILFTLNKIKIYKLDADRIDIKLLYIGDFIKGNGPSTVDINLYDNLTAEKYCENIDKKLSLSYFKGLFNCNVVIVSGISFKGLLTIIFSKLLCKKSIFIMHGILQEEKQYRNISKYRIIFEKLNIILVSKVVCVSNSLKQKAKEIFNIDKFISINNGIDEDLIKNYDEQLINNEKTEGIILSVGGGRKEKNILKICEALDLAENKDFKFIVVGEDGPDTEKIKKYDFVDYKGFINKIELQKLYRITTVYIQNSIYEPFGLAPLEAIMNGCDVLLSENVTLLDYLNNIGNDSIIKNNDSLITISNKIMDKLNKKTKNKIDINSLLFSWKNIANEYQQLAECLLNK